MIRVSLHMSNTVATASWESPERRFDGLASPEVKETSNSHQNHLFENETAES
jgi:hypothetical protein